MSDNGAEYVFVLPDGSERYEIVFEPSDVWAFQKMHGAIKAMPLKQWEAQKEGSQ